MNGNPPKMFIFALPFFAASQKDCQANIAENSNIKNRGHYERTD